MCGGRTLRRDKTAAAVKHRDESSKIVERIASDYVSYMRREEVRKACEILRSMRERWNAVLEKKRLMKQLGERWGPAVLSYIVFHSGTVPAERKRWREQILAKETEYGAAAFCRQQAQILRYVPTRLLS